MFFSRTLPAVVANCKTPKRDFIRYNQSGRAVEHRRDFHEPPWVFMWSSCEEADLYADTDQQAGRLVVIYTETRLSLDVCLWHHAESGHVLAKTWLHSTRRASGVSEPSRVTRISLWREAGIRSHFVSRTRWNRRFACENWCLWGTIEPLANGDVVPTAHDCTQCCLKYVPTWTIAHSQACHQSEPSINLLMDRDAQEPMR